MQALPLAPAHDEAGAVPSQGHEPIAPSQQGGPHAWARDRPLAVAVAIYTLLTVVYLATTPPQRLVAHTPYNHYALLADAWLHGRLDLGGPPPPYTGNNDFARFDDRHYVSFPPFPAVLLVPVVAYAGHVERVRDGQFFLWLAGIGPAAMYLALERLRAGGRLVRSGQRSSPSHSVALALLLGLGTVYWFSAVQGTVWFAAHVVGMGLACLYVWLSLDARHPLLAGLVLGLAFATRPAVVFAWPLFAYELLRAARTDLRPALRIARGATAFGLAAGVVIFAVMWHNHARFGDPFELGHRLLDIGWRARIERWGLFSYHYLGRNLAVLLTGLPFVGRDGAVQINAHGLALWLTTPAFLWALWPKRTPTLFWVLVATTLAVAAPSLLYQNTGWVQFGYRFSNDFAPFLVLMIAVGGRRLSVPFWLAASVGVVVNGAGALTFDRAAYRHLYFIDGSQRVLHHPD